MPSHNPFHRATYLTGPTASGKTAVAVALAKRLDAEIIALDSASLYRGMDIGTAKPTLAERGGIAHHLIDVIDPWQISQCFRLSRLGGQRDRRNRKSRPARSSSVEPRSISRSCSGVFFPGLRPTSPPASGSSAKPTSTARKPCITGCRSSTQRRLRGIHPHDRRRVIRALEVIEQTGGPLSALQLEHAQPAPESVAVFALEPPRAVLHERINRRVLDFFRAGFVEEVRALMSAPQPLSAVAAQAIGYREVIAMLAGQASLELTIERIQARTRQFAKRQATWFRGLREVQSLPVDPAQSPESLAARLELEVLGKVGS